MARAHTRIRAAPRPRPADPPVAPANAWVAPVLVGLTALLVYANSLRNGFVWDDPIILARQLVVFRSAGDVLAPPRNIPQFSPDYYRPLTIASYLLDRAVGGDRPFMFHLSLVLAHAATSVLVYALALQLSAPPLPRGHLWPRGRAREGARAGANERPREGPSALAALTAGALFAVHPIHTESVAWAAGRSDVLATGFLLGALLIHGRPRRSWSGSALAGLCAAAALGAKETAVTLYPLMLQRDLLAPAWARRSAADWLRGYTGPLVAGVVYALLRRNALGELVGSAPDALAAGQRSPLDLVGAIGMYVEKLLWPVDLNAYIDHIAAGPLTIGLAALLVGSLGGGLWYWWSESSRVQGFEGSRVRGFKGLSGAEGPSNPRTLEPSNPGLPLFAIAWLVLTLVPSLAIVWKIPDAPLAERYLYLPSVGFCLLAGDLVARLWLAASARRARVLIACGLGALLLVAAIGTVRRNRVWHDDVALWGDTEPKSQVSGMAARGLGTAYQKAGRAADARAAFERALQRRNTPRGVLTIHNNLGTLAMYDGDYAAAQRYYQAALSADPNAPDTLFNLGLAVLQGGGRSRESAEAALRYYQRAARLSPYDPDVEAAIAQALGILDQPTAAAEHARRALELGAQGPTAESLRALLRQGESASP